MVIAYGRGHNERMERVPEMKRGWLALVGIQLVLIPLVSSAIASPQESAVERRVGRIRTWRELRQALHRSSFDDGIVAEMYSEFVVHTLASKWDTLKQLQTLVAADPAFGKFVLRHIDATADRGELVAVLRHARQAGSRQNRGLRRRIASAAKRALAHP